MNETHLVGAITKNNGIVLITKDTSNTTLKRLIVQQNIVLSTTTVARE